MVSLYTERDKPKESRGIFFAVSDLFEIFNDSSEVDISSILQTYDFKG